jgi:hypothetical protein
MTMTGSRIPSPYSVTKILKIFHSVRKRNFPQQQLLSLVQEHFGPLHTETECTTLLQVYTDTYSISVLVSAELPCAGRGFPQH